MKDCTKCGKYTTYEEMTKDANKPLGVGSWCTNCFNKNRRERRKTDGDLKLKESVYRKNWLKAKLEKEPNYMKDTQRKSILKRKAEGTYNAPKYVRKSWEAEKIRIILAGKKDCDIDIDYLKTLYLIQEGKCYYTGITLTTEFAKVPTKVSVDRLDSSLGYLKGNVVLCCLSISFAKNSWSLKEFKNFLKLIKNPLS